MDKMTYKEFEKKMSSLGYIINDDYERHTYIVDINRGTVATVSKLNYKQLDLNWDEYEYLPEEEKEVFADLCWQLASTPLKDREEPKKYYLKVCQKYLPFFSSSYEYLNINTRTGRMELSTEIETTLCKTIFTEEEINELAKECDLSLFERVEVEDD